ncbi:MAG: PAC2 family protein [Candidatus Woesearchaeota archaeon]|nr:PAC2 family protein [Candidatus Woesearchaeota archaeon]
MTWKIKKLSNVEIKNPILIEGLPGIGNVGKIAVDFIVDELKAKKVFEISSYNIPHYAFINEKSILELPKIEIYYKNVKNKDLLFLVGDTQPLNEESCYEFCDTILDTFENKKFSEIITIGGIALPKIPKAPRIYCAGTHSKIVHKYKSLNACANLNGMVGPIIGVSGVLTGLAGRRNIPAISLLVETFGHPNYLGVKGAKEVLKLLKKQFNLKIDPNKLNDQVQQIEQEIKNNREIKKIIKKQSRDISYIG